MPENKLKVAVPPVKVAFEMTVPLSTSDTDVIPVGDIPDSVRVKLLKVTALLPGLVSWTCCIVTPEAPADWVELAGGFGPCEVCIVTSVGVVVNVRVEVAVEVAVGVAVLVAKLANVFVAVVVAV